MAQTKAIVKDEQLFFTSLSSILGEEYLLSKSTGKKIDKSHVFLSGNYADYSFNSDINNSYRKMLITFRSDFRFASLSLAHHIDGMTINHPILKTRIIEFDEEQHFTPARDESLMHFSLVKNGCLNRYKQICSDITYFNKSVLKKHHIKNTIDKMPLSYNSFTKWLILSNEKKSGYITETNGFDFLGGRIAQRAYYDCLRDTAHLSPLNKHLTAPIRFAKKTFEDTHNAPFAKIPMFSIRKTIIEILCSDYGITF